jgi:ABC-type antimicrobial peptide transport system permease subunit
LVLRQSLGWTAAGILSGVVVAAALSGLLSSMVFGISVYDPVTYAGVPIFLFLVAVAAGYAPARRATRVDPLISLRNE